jgi:archaellum component FlaC
LILACDKLLAEQKETIETLQSSVKSMDMEYKKLAAEYNALS